jgi:hypothetical protein
MMLLDRFPLRLEFFSANNNFVSAAVEIQMLILALSKIVKLFEAEIALHYELLSSLQLKICVFFRLHGPNLPFFGTVLAEITKRGLVSSAFAIHAEQVAAYALIYKVGPKNSRAFLASHPRSKHGSQVIPARGRLAGLKGCC